MPREAMSSTISTPGRAGSAGNVVELNEVRVVFGDLVALDGLTLSVAPGEIVGLLGPNGAGKTTTMDVCCGLRVPASGTARVLDLDAVKSPRQLRANIGVVPQDSGLYPELSPYEHLHFAAALYDLRQPKARIEGTLRLMGLWDRRGQRVSTLSKGMRRRLALARALLHDPALLFLDEPTLGVDVQGRRALWEHILRLREEGRSVLLTTNYLDEASALCDRVAIMDRGRTLICSSPAELRRGAGVALVLACASATAQVAASLRARADVLHVAESSHCVRVRPVNEAATAQIVAAADAIAKVTSVRVEEPNLEDVFLALTGKALRE